MNKMSKRLYTIVYLNSFGETFKHTFTLEDLFSHFENNKELKNTELHYTLTDEKDLILDMKKGETISTYLDRAKEFICLLHRTK